MGIEASYRRITLAEWEKVRSLAEGEDAVSGTGLEEAYLEFSQSEGLISGSRYLSIEKEWHALHALLTGNICSPSDIKPFPPPLGNVVMGGAETPFPATQGMVRVLMPGEVRDVAEALAAITPDELESRFDPDAFNKAHVYPYPRPGGWDREELEPLLAYYPELVAFFSDAAGQGDVVLLSFD